MRVLVIDGGRNGLGVARSLADAGLGLEVHLAGPNRFAAARYSRAVQRFWPVPSPDRPDEWLPAMRAIGERLRGDDGAALLFPVNDIYVLQGARHWGELSLSFSAAFETRPDALDQCLAKDRCYELAEQVGVCVPIWGRSGQEFVGSGGKLPAIVKPAIRNAPEFAGNRPFRARVCQTTDEIDRACQELLAANARPVVQEFIVGGDDTLVTAGIAAANGRVLAAFTGRKLRQFPPQVGEASYAESMAADGAAADAGRLLGAIGFTGVSQVEFKRREGRDYLLEVNPRSWSWIGLSTASGVDLPAILVATLLGQPASSARQENGRTWVYSLQDLRYHAIAGGPRWLAQVLGATVHAHWRWNDPMPALSQLWNWAAARLVR